MPLVFTSTEHSIGSEPGLPPYPMVSVKEPILSDNQQAQLRVLVKARAPSSIAAPHATAADASQPQDDPNAIGWCPMCPGQVMPPLPPVAFTCPTCPEGETCGPCKAGETINPAATMYIALGAPASCPACPNGEPTKQDVQEQHNDDKNQLPADLGSADTLAKQNGENVTVHVKCVPASCISAACALAQARYAAVGTTTSRTATAGTSPRRTSRTPAMATARGALAPPPAAPPRARRRPPPPALRRAPKVCLVPL